MVRSPMQVDEDFRKRMKQIQKEIMKRNGEFRSIPKITKEVVAVPEWAMVEKRLLENMDNLELGINFDKRKG